MGKSTIFLHRFNYLIIAILNILGFSFIISVGLKNEVMLIITMVLIIFIGHKLLLNLLISLIKYPVNEFGNPDRDKIPNTTKEDYGWYKTINDDGTCELIYYYKASGEIKVLIEHKQVKLYDTIYK